MIRLASTLALAAALAAAPLAARSAPLASAPTLLALPGSDLRYVVVSFRAGSADDPKGREGLAALAAATVGRQIEQALEAKAPASGAWFSYHCDVEWTTFRFKCHRETFDEAWRAVAPLLSRPVVDARSVAPAAAMLASWRASALENGEELSRLALTARAYRGHPYAHPVFGTRAGLAACTPSDVRRFIRDRYGAAGLALGLAASDPAELAALVAPALARLPAGRPPRPVPPPEPEPGVKVLLVRRALPTASVAFGFHHRAGRADPAYPALLVANAGFGQHRCLTGLLFRELRAVRGFNYGDYSYIERFVEGRQDKMPETRVVVSHPFFSVWIRNLDERNAVFALMFAVRALRSLPERAGSEPYFSVNRTFISNYMRLFAFDPFQRLGFAMDDAALGAPDFFADTPRALAALSPGDVRDAVARHLPGRDLVVAIATSDPETMRSRLLGELPAAPHYRAAIPPEAARDDEETLRYDLRIDPAAVEIVDAENLF